MRQNRNKELNLLLVNFSFELPILVLHEASARLTRFEHKELTLYSCGTTMQHSFAGSTRLNRELWR
ncbi:MAG: hypothetical protein OXC80_07380 [Gammaproteobacteria bacterium]|nr:hypothetical protein [Gammaproteobacteria bacterium]